ncbi:hypothetical protein [Chryseobacterium daeguense]|uniref:hypothetical protein n=1 Tax=Chryseobacterium daeguense TaxID=412438 RepID=UPI00040807CB|nr:hypothetical protein [Chryseobacterium daeguense]
MKDFFLYVAAVIILVYVNFYNRKLVKIKGSIQGYDRSQALALDVFAGRNYRSLWNETLIEKNGYKFGIDGETMSSVLGKNEIDGTLTSKPHPDFPKWFYGRNLSKILDKVFKENKHCINAIDLTKGDWKFPFKS